LPEIDLHDVRHSYATAGRSAKIDWKALSRRIGHADVTFTLQGRRFLLAAIAGSWWPFGGMSGARVRRA
jgi:integrase